MATEPVVLAVDDEPGILRLLKLELGRQGFRVLTCETGQEALTASEVQRPDIVVLDLLMPQMGGLEVMKRLRERTNVPVILLTAQGYDQDRVTGLDLGADDFIQKPFNAEELGARIRAVLRRGQTGVSGGTGIVRSGDLLIDLGKRTVVRGSEPVSLTRTEWLLLQELALNAGKVMANAELLSKVWGPEFVDDIQYLRVWMSRLRYKLEADPPNPVLLKTFPGIGYQLESDNEASP